MTKAVHHLLICACFCAAILPAGDLHADVPLRLGSLRSETAEAGLFAPDVASWNTLADTLIATVAPVSVRPARTVGPSGFEFALHSSVFFLSSEAEGALTRAQSGTPQLALSGLEISKGLPFGFQVSAAVFRPHGFRAWSPALTLQLALFESYERGVLRYVPDVALRAGFRALSGHRAMRVFALSMDVVLSKAISIQDLILTPMLTTGLAFGAASTRDIDLTPERDAVAECDPTYEPFAPDDVSLIRCRGSAQDFQNVARFPRRDALLFRVALGLELRWEHLFVAGAVQLVFGAQAPTSLAFQGGARF